MTNIGNSELQIVGRILEGRNLVGYYVQSADGKQQYKLAKDICAYLIGKGVITNCGGDINYSMLPVDNGKVKVGKFAPRSKGNLDSLPVVQLNANSEQNTKIGQLSIIARLTVGTRTVGYEVENQGKGRARISREKLLELAANDAIANATVQNYTKNGQSVKILRGKGINIESLPAIEVLPDDGT